MRTIVHLSDLHFGRIDPAVVDALAAAVPTLRPDLVAISGDLTQRAREQEFRQAREFLDRLPQPQMVVPGNHDVPLHNLFKRFTHPLRLYRRYISNVMEPFFERMNSTTLMRHLEVDPDLDPIRNDGRFKEMLADAKRRLGWAEPVDNG